MKKNLLILALLLPPANAAHARRGEKAVECVDAAGKTRFASGRCAKGEREVVPKAIAPKPRAKIPASPGVLSDRDGEAVLPRLGRWTVHNAVARFKWDKKSGTWKPKGRVGKEERAALRDAASAFNTTRGLGLELVYKESEDAAFDLNDPWKHRDRFVVYWAKDAKPGSLPKPYRVRNGANAGGCSVIVENPNGTRAYGVDGRLEPGAKIVGAALFMVEFSRRVRKSFSCPGTAGRRYELLHQIGHCLGLGHKTPSPSIMGGTCGEDYYPNDIANFRALYGAR